MKEMEKLKKAKAAVVTVGGGCGFVIEHGQERFVITAAHCLPVNERGQLPFPAMSISGTDERTIPLLLAPLGGNPAIWAECMFADPIADIAVLGSPSHPDLFDQVRAYRELMATVTPIAIAKAEDGPAWLLSLDGNWFPCNLNDTEFAFWLSTAGKIEFGMSGSPIVSADGKAIGIVCTGNGRGGMDGPNPNLTVHLPGWLVR